MFVRVAHKILNTVLRHRRFAASGRQLSIATTVGSFSPRFATMPCVACFLPTNLTHPTTMRAFGGGLGRLFGPHQLRWIHAKALLELLKLCTWHFPATDLTLLRHHRHGLVATPVALK